MANLAKDMTVALLLDFYGGLLTQKQQEFLEHYYNDDLSLSEIAQNEGITRQGVRDAVKRAERQLYDYEEQLALVRRFEEQQRDLSEIIRCANVVHQQNLRHGLSREINEAAAQIRATAEAMMER
ncbi:MAG: DNA-binding protein [Oscillospiraceae bacterium]|jgi:predicted DNA-binding protein YlxM (UPF0122 family)|nr:DNA-binding protein [Oscillospiraceae bacterium]